MPDSPLTIPISELDDFGIHMVGDGPPNQRTVHVSISVDCNDLDIATEKANRLVELLREASYLIDSLSAGIRSET